MILRDPVHGLVSFERDEEAIVGALVETAEVQRLRHIRQLGLSSLSYPGADHTRFSHAVGTAHVMTRFIARIRQIHDALPFWQRLTTERARDALAAALLHDVGHGPYSHLFEEALGETPSHETWTSRILLDSGTEVGAVLRAADADLPRRVSELVHGRHELPYLARAVSGSFDVDRCDYLLRDAHFTGVSYGRYDLDWLLRSFRFDRGRDDAGAAPALAVDGAKGLPAIESFVLARLFMFQQVYFHKSARASEWMLGAILRRVRVLVQDGKTPAGTPQAIVDLVRDGDTALDRYLTLDDSALWQSLRRYREASDSVLADLADRLTRRRLFKTYELFGDYRERAAELLARCGEIATASGLDPAWYVGLDEAYDVPFDDAQERLSVLFPRTGARKPGDVSFLLARLRGERLERARLVFAPELREPIREMLER